MKKIAGLFWVFPLFFYLALADGPRLSLGNWGGSHIKMTVFETGAHLKLECARGEIQQPLVLDSDQHFTAIGVVQSLMGPIELDNPSLPLPATFSGIVRDKTLTLTVSYKDSKGIAHADTYSLLYGEKGSLEYACAL